MTKRELRIKYKYLRSLLSDDEIAELSLSISNNILELPIWEHSCFHIFLPIVSQNEVDTEYILHVLAGKDKNIVVSKSDFTTREMQHFLLTDATKLVVNEYGIPEPVNGIEVASENLDVVFVPLLAFDLDGNRVGYGKGFYDRFLTQCPKAIKVGLSFYEAEPFCSDVFESDVKLDYCVTPNEKVYRF